MTPVSLDIVGAAEMEALGRRVGSLLRRGDLVILSGELGAGKTTLTRGIGEGMGVRGPITSPTFVLSRVHPPEAPGKDVPLVHVDAYRLGSPRELDDLDLDFDGAAVVVEWGDGMLDDVADSWLRIRIERARSMREGRSDEAKRPDEDARQVTLEGHGAEWGPLRLASLAQGPRDERSAQRPEEAEA